MSDPDALPPPGSAVTVRHLWDGGQFSGVLVEQDGEVVTRESRGDTWARLRLDDGSYWWALWSTDTTRVRYELLTTEEPPSAQEIFPDEEETPEPDSAALDVQRLNAALAQAQARNAARERAEVPETAPEAEPEASEEELPDWPEGAGWDAVRDMIVDNAPPAGPPFTPWESELPPEDESEEQAPEDEAPEGEEVLPTQEALLRPKTLDEYDVGQARLVTNLKVRIAAALERGEALPHCLFDGPPGLGKTTLAYVIANELGVKMHPTSGPALEEPSAVLGLLFNLAERDVLFVDEIHRLPRVVGEYLYHAMEDFQIDYIEGEGAEAQTTVRKLEPFTLIGATTNSGAIAPALRDRFGIRHHLEYYRAPQLAKIGERTAAALEVEIDAEALEQLSNRSRGTARVVNSLIQQARDWAFVLGDGTITPPLVEQALAALGIDEVGLSLLDRRYMTAILDYYDGGPVGIRAIAATLGEELGTIEAVVEPYLVMRGYVTRTARGRTLTERGKEHAARHREED